MQRRSWILDKHSRVLYLSWFFLRTLGNNLLAAHTILQMYNKCVESSRKLCRKFHLIFQSSTDVEPVFKIIKPHSRRTRPQAVGIRIVIGYAGKLLLGVLTRTTNVEQIARRAKYLWKALFDSPKIYKYTTTSRGSKVALTDKLASCSYHPTRNCVCREVVGWHFIKLYKSRKNCGEWTKFLWKASSGSLQIYKCRIISRGSKVAILWNVPSGWDSLIMVCACSYIDV